MFNVATLDIVCMQQVVDAAHTSSISYQQIEMPPAKKNFTFLKRSPVVIFRTRIKFYFFAKEGGESAFF
jgi:hypothetical protein